MHLQRYRALETSRSSKCVDVSHSSGQAASYPTEPEEPAPRRFLSAVRSCAWGMRGWAVLHPCKFWCTRTGTMRSVESEGAPCVM